MWATGVKMFSYFFTLTVNHGNLRFYKKKSDICWEESLVHRKKVYELFLFIQYIYFCTNVLYVKWNLACSITVHFIFLMLPQIHKNTKKHPWKKYSWWTSCRSCWSGQRSSSTSHLMFSIAMHRGKMIERLRRVWQFKGESTRQFWSTSHLQLVVVQTADNCTYCLHTWQINKKFQSDVNKKLLVQRSELIV